MAIGRGQEPPGRRLGPVGVTEGMIVRTLALAVISASLATGVLWTALTRSAVALVGVVPSAFVWELSWRALRDIRHAAWLDGTVLYVRRPFGTHRCDLAAAVDLRISGVTWGDNRRIPVLVARADVMQRPLRYPLVCSNGRALPIDARRELADVIEAHAPALAAVEIAAQLRKRWFIDIGKVFSL